MKLPLFIMLIIISLHACRSLPAGNDYRLDKDIMERCCNQCFESFGRSPAAIGKEGAWCGKFMTASPLSKPCREYFQKFPSTVETCGK